MNKQKGSALIISLLILLVMTMLGITSMSTSTMEEKMAANDRNHKLAFQVAESTVAKVEKDINERTWFGGLHADFSNSNGYYRQDEADFNVYDYSAWNAGTSCVSGAANNNGSSCYTVKNSHTSLPMEAPGYGQPNFTTQISRITVRGNGPDDLSNALVQTHYRKLITP